MDLSHTIIPKSDQLNADDLIAGPITITVTEVTLADTPEQPVIVRYENEQGRPYKPCKSMRRVLIHAWGKDGRQWPGRSMSLFCDPDVQFGGQKVGGIRISHLSHIDGSLQIMLTTTRSKRKAYRVEPMPQPQPAAKSRKRAAAPQPEWYPEEKFVADLPRMLAAIESGRSTVEKIVAHLEKTAPLTDEQKARLAPDQAETDQAETDDVIF